MTKIAIFIRKNCIEVRIKRKYTNRMFIKPRYGFTYLFFEKFLMPFTGKYVDYDKYKSKVIEILSNRRSRIIAELLFTNYSKRMFKAVLRDLVRTVRKTLEAINLPDESFIGKNSKPDNSMIFIMPKIDLYPTIQPSYFRTVHTETSVLEYYIAMNGRTLYVSHKWDADTYVIHSGKTDKIQVLIDDKKMKELSEMITELLKNVSEEDRDAILKIIAESPIITYVI